jgi:hypothetical protein
MFFPIFDGMMTARRQFYAARKAVLDWMEAERAAGRDREAGDAPGWNECAAAQKRWLSALAAFDVEVVGISPLEMERR